jgi:hypothetical protein
MIKITKGVWELAYGFLGSTYISCLCLFHGEEMFEPAFDCHDFNILLPYLWVCYFQTFMAK